MDKKEKGKNFETLDSDPRDSEDFESEGDKAEVDGYKYKNDDKFIFFQVNQFVRKIINEDLSLSHIKQEVIQATREKIKKLESVMLPLIGEYKRKFNDFWFSDNLISFSPYKNRVKIRFYSRYFFYEAFIILLNCRNIIIFWAILLVLVGGFFLFMILLVYNLNFYLYLSVLLTYIQRLLIFTILIVLLGFMFGFMNKFW